MSNGADMGTFLCRKCGLRVAEDRRSEHLEADHGVCGRRGCEAKLDEKGCPRCDAEVTP